MVRMAQQLGWLLAVSGMMLSAEGQVTASDPAAQPLVGETEGAQKVVTDFLKKLGGDADEILLPKKNQGAIAAFFFLFGMVALVDGRRSLKILIAAGIGLATFAFQLHHLQPAGNEHMTAVALYIAAAEVALLMTYVAFKGWEGTQLLLGFGLGMYFFDMLFHYAMTAPVLSSFAKQIPVVVGVCTVMVAAGVWAIHERGGGQKVLGLLAPVIGSSFVVSAIGWCVIASCSLPNPPPIGVTVAAADVPAVIQFWNMIVFPMDTEAVGVFGAAGKFLLIGSSKISIDRVLGIFFWVVFLLLGIRFQVRTDASTEIMRTINELSGAQDNLQDLKTQLKGLSAVDKRPLLNSH